MTNNYSMECPPYSNDFDLVFKDEGVEGLFNETQDAIFTLYEELFNSGESIDAKLIYNAVKYLLWRKGMINQYEELEGLTEDDICVRHYSEVNKSVEDKLSYFKTIITQTVEDYV